MGPCEQQLNPSDIWVSVVTSSCIFFLTQHHESIGVRLCGGITILPTFYAQLLSFLAAQFWRLLFLRTCQGNLGEPWNHHSFFFLLDIMPLISRCRSMEMQDPYVLIATMSVRVMFTKIKLNLFDDRGW